MVIWRNLPAGWRRNNSCDSVWSSGASSAKLFTDLDQLEVGDTFQITVLDRVLVYEVTQTEVVLPEELNGLTAESDKDQVTLVTCTPYGVNSHRL